MRILPDIQSFPLTLNLILPLKGQPFDGNMAARFVQLRVGLGVLDWISGTNPGSR